MQHSPSFALQPPLVQAIFNRNAEEVQLLLHKKEEVNALVSGHDETVFPLFPVRRQFFQSER